MTKDELKAWREKHGLTQGEAADCLARSIRTYQKYEQGELPVPEFVERWLTGNIGMTHVWMDTQ